MTVILDGAKPLWETQHEYLRFIADHNLDIWMHSVKGDENALLIVDLFVLMFQQPLTEEQRAGLLVVVERYIHDYHPEIATIQGGYPKSARDTAGGGR